eukprot:GHVU01048802.1.p1 GENE.GHVU01048802.1~~GHVU01048802.1.p1  ORF type:complete len:139 (+),score=1.34 GHVU01048802.1:85-501(+)
MLAKLSAVLSRRSKKPRIIVVSGRNERHSPHIYTPQKYMDKWSIYWNYIYWNYMYLPAKGNDFVVRRCVWDMSRLGGTSSPYVQLRDFFLSPASFAGTGFASVMPEVRLRDDVLCEYRRGISSLGAPSFCICFAFWRQ